MICVSLVEAPLSPGRNPARLSVVTHLGPRHGRRPGIFEVTT